MTAFRWLCLFSMLVFAGCASTGVHNHVLQEKPMLASDVRVTEHRGNDDLLSAGLGLAGLKGAQVAFSDPAKPTPAELRRRAIQANWQDIADLGPLGGYGSVYGTVPAVPGREYQAFAQLPGAAATHRVLAQVPDAFDEDARCLIVAASSGSRGAYGAIALAGAFGLPRGCAVVYTDKGAGTGYFDSASQTGVQLEGTRALAGDAMLEFEPINAPADAGIAVKHLHSGDNPEADWGRHVLQAAQFGLMMLDRAFPDAAPFTADNTQIIATGLSNGGGAVLQAAGFDERALLDAVVALEPNVHLPNGGRALYDYATEAALWMPCALADARFEHTPLARHEGQVPSAFVLRCASLHQLGLLHGTTVLEQADEALAHLHANGWTDEVIATAAATTVFDVWRAVAAGYASAYVGTPVGQMPCGFSYHASEADSALRASWWAEASGIPPGAGIALLGGTDDSADPTLPGVRCLRALWTEDGDAARKLHASIGDLAAELPRKDLPIWVLHGASDGLLPVAFTSDAYVAWLRKHDRAPHYWAVPHAQHFDAFLALPGFGAEHVPLLPYGYFALDAMYQYLVEGTPLPNLPVPNARPRGDGPLTKSMLALP